MPKEQTDFYHEFKERLKNRSEMPFDEFVELALYHPYLGYYSKSKARVGKEMVLIFILLLQQAPYGESLLWTPVPKY